MLAFLLAACTSTNDIAGKDKDMLFPTGRVTIRTRKETPPPEGGADEAAELERRWRVDIEVSATGGEGDFGARLLAGESIDINGTVFSGPANLVADFRLFEASVAAKAGWQLDKIDIMGLLGVGYSNFDLEVTDGATTGRANESGIGPLAGIQVSWEPIKRVELYARGTFLIVLADATSGQFELGGGFAVTRNVFLFGGYRWWRYRHEVAFSNFNDFDIRAGGFVLGLELRF